MKAIISMALVLVLSLSLCGCRRNNKETEPTTVPTTVAPTVMPTVPMPDPTIPTNIPDPGINQLPTDENPATLPGATDNTARYGIMDRK